MGSAVTIALPTMQESLSTTIEGVQWIVNVYVLSLGALILLSGSLGDIFGLRRIFVVGVLTFTVGTGLCAIAPTLWFLLVARGVQGIGAALMIPGSLAILNTSFRRDERGTVIGLWAGVSGAVAALGPLFGGALATVSWRLVFVGVVPIGVATLMASLRSVPSSSIGRGEAKEVDALGALWIFLALAGISFVLVRAPNVGFGWLEVAALAMGILALTSFVLREKRTATPLVPLTAFTKRVVGANLVTVFLYFSLQGTLFLLSFTLQQLNGMSATIAGLAVLPATLVIAALSGPSGRITDAYGPRVQIVVGPVVVFGACALLSLADRESGYAGGYLPAILLLGLGMVITIPAVTRTALDVENRFSGAASGVNNAAARVAGLLAVAVAGGALAAGFRVGVRERLANTTLPTATVEAIVARSSRLLTMNLPQGLSPSQQGSVRDALEQSFVEGIRAGAVICAAAALAATLPAVVLVTRKSKSVE